MNSLEDIAKRLEGGGKGEGVMTCHDLVMIWDDMVYLLNDSGVYRWRANKSVAYITLISGR